MTLISNEYRTCSMSDPGIAEAVNEAKGRDLDPLEMLIELEERADVLWNVERPRVSRRSFVEAYVSMALENL